MACYHFTLKPVSRGTGASVVAKAAYHSGERLSDSYYGNVHDYTKKVGIVYKEIFLPPHASERLKDRETLWNEVEQVEKNKRAQLANNFEIALMNEFTMDENIMLTKLFVQEQFVARGMIADVAIHDPPRILGEEPNPHIHVMCPMRPLNEDGGWGIKQKKEIVLDENGQPVIGSNGKPKERAYSVTGWNSKETLQDYRKAWADIVNDFAELKGLSVRVDHRTLKEQGIDRLPTIHEGPDVRAMEKKGIRTTIGDLNRMIRYVNRCIGQVRDLFDWIKVKKQELDEKYESVRNEVRKPNLINYLMDYYDERNQKAEQFQYGTRKAKVTNLKQLAEITSYLEQEQIRTPAQLQERISSLSDRFEQVRNEIEAQLSLNRDYKERLRAWELYQKTKPVFDEYQKKYFLKEKFRKEHQKEINTYRWANRYLKDYQDEHGKVNPTLWKKEADSAKEKAEALKPKKQELATELQMLKKIRSCIEEIEDNEAEVDRLKLQKQREKELEKEVIRQEPAVPQRKPKKRSYGMEL